MGNSRYLNLLVISTALDTHKKTNAHTTHKDSDTSEHMHMLVEGQLAQGESDRLIWSNVSMTTFNWMVNQLLICLSTAWCGQHEMKKERESGGEREKTERDMEEKKGGDRGEQMKRDERKRENWWVCVCAFVCIVTSPGCKRYSGNSGERKRLV